MTNLRQFLYVSPFFPPVSRVGALRPLKFARHLPDHGWAPVVLCDLQRTDEMSRELASRIPESTVVVRDYGPGARACERAFASGRLPLPLPDEASEGGLARRIWRAALRAYRSPTFWWPSDEYLPLGSQLRRMRHGLAAARRALAQHPGCEAIMVNADPNGALLVGARLAEETGLPLVQDLRDPWAHCDLRRRLRPLPQRRIIDGLERRALRNAAAIVLNTETTLAEYRSTYADIVAPERFHVIRNHGDPELVEDGTHPGFDRFSALFLGNFRRFVGSEALVEALARLRARGIDGTTLQLVVSGRMLGATWLHAHRLGVSDMLSKHRFVPYTQTGAAMEAADLLVSLSHRTKQRIPAKFYDYVLTGRPMLVVTDNPELAALAGGLAGVDVRGLDDTDGIADAIHAAFVAGRQRTFERAIEPFHSRAAAARLASIFDRVTAARR
jgi:glycosyltransferase involved in cell wall biosynthesis